MNRELWLLRHGKADRSLNIEDFDRPLKKRGKRAAQQVGVWMKQQNLIPDLVISSPAQRAIATAQIVCTAIGLSDRDIKQDKRLYAEGFERLKDVLAASPNNAKNVLLVGHNPELEDLLIYLAGTANVPNEGKLLPTAALARLKMPDEWTRLENGCASLLSIIHPKSLSEGGI
jgi:phosphohistidine phosphatase